MSEQPIGSHPINWGAVSTVASIIGMLALGVAAFAVLGERQTNTAAEVAALKEVARDHGESIAKVREDRSIERQLNELTLKVELLRQEVAQGNEKRKR